MNKGRPLATHNTHEPIIYPEFIYHPENLNINTDNASVSTFSCKFGNLIKSKIDQVSSLESTTTAVNKIFISYS